MKTLVLSIFALFCFTTTSQSFNDANFISLHKVEAKRGDAIIKLLKKYDLIEHQCNVDAFYELNKMKKGDVLFAGKKYMMPISIFEYNRTSIRSTIGRDDWDLAKKIAKYNRDLRDNRLKKSYYMDDAKLFVPYHLMDCQGVLKAKQKKEEVAEQKEEKTNVEPTAKTVALTTTAPEVKNDLMVGHHGAEARKGDGIFHLLARYDLYDSECNREKFYALNNLNAKSGLFAGRAYALPILIYNYNRESIRSTIGKDDWDLARKIAAYNRKLVSKGLKKSDYMKDAILYVPFHYLDCPDINTSAVKTAKVVKTNVVEDKRVYLTNELYGDAAKFEKVSDKLKGEAYYVICGHGGPDPGAMCTHGKSDLCEDEYAYDVSLRLARNLEANGAKVFIIIQDKNDGIRDYPLLPLDYDEVCINGDAIPRKQLHRLKQRVKAVNDNYRKNKSKYTKHKVISIHIDSRPLNKRQDVFFYHAPGSESGKKLARNIQDTFREKYKIHQSYRKYEGTVSERNLYVLRNTNPTAVFVELANIQNHRDQKRILIPNQRQALADWLYEGMTK